MSEHLSPRERALLDALQRDDTPDGSEQRRVKQRVFAELGLGVVGGALVATATATSHAAPASGIAATAAGAAKASGAAKAAGATKAAGVANAGLQSATNVAAQAPAALSLGASALGGGIGTAVSSGGVATSGLAAVAAKLGTTKMVLGLVAALATAGGTALWSAQHLPVAATTPPSVTVLRVPDHPTPDVVDLAVEATLSAPVESLRPSPPRAPRAPSTRSTLDDEAHLLTQAQQKIAQGDANAALSVLSEHQRQFPRGTLSLERQATFAIARCLSGQTSRGKTDALRFRRQHPNSPMVKRLESACQLPAP